MNPSKKMYMVLILAVVLGVSLAPASMVFSEEWSAPEKVLEFLTDAVKLDVTSYDVKLVSNNASYPSDLGGLIKEEGKYTLEANGSKLDVFYAYINGTLHYLNIYPLEGATIYSETLPTNVLDSATVFLQRYQTLTGFSNLQGIREVLSTLEVADDQVTVVGNIKLIVKTSSATNHTSFNWVYTFNGVEYNTGIYLSFRKGSLFTFGDNRHYQIGGTAVNISKEQAINIAKMQAQNTSWTVNMGNGSVVEVANVTILDDHTGASLLSAPREPLVLYPHWTVSLTFDQVYPGYVYGVTYNIWADTGEVFYGFLTTLGGSLSSETDSSAITTSPTLPSQPPQQSPPQLDDPPDSPPEMTAPPSDAPPAQEPQDSGSALPLEYGYAAAVVSIIAVAATALLLKRKKGK